MKLSLFADDMILYIENPGDATRKLLQLIGEFGKVAGCRIDAQKSLAFLYTNDGESEGEIEKTLPFTTATKRMIYLGVSLPWETKDLYAENYGTLMRETGDDAGRWRDIPCSWIGRINIVRVNILPRAIYRFGAVPIKLPLAFFTELEQRISRFVWRHRRPRIAKAILRKKGGAGGVGLPDFRLCCRATVIEAVWWWHKDRGVDRWSRMEGPEVKPRTYGHLIFDKGSGRVQWRKDILFGEWCWEN